MLNTHVVNDYISIMLGDWVWSENTMRINGKRCINLILQNNAKIVMSKKHQSVSEK